MKLLMLLLAVYLIFHESFMSNELLNRVALFVLTIQLFGVILYKYRNVLFN